MRVFVFAVLAHSCAADCYRPRSRLFAHYQKPFQFSHALKAIAADSRRGRLARRATVVPRTITSGLPKFICPAVDYSIMSISKSGAAPQLPCPFRATDYTFCMPQVFS